MNTEKENTVKLTDKQKRFADEYLIDLNATQAAIRAGYSAKTANEQGSQLLSITKVQEYIAERKFRLNQQLENKFLISKERVLQEYAYPGFSDLRGFFNPDGSVKAITELSDEQAACLASIEVHEQFTHVDGKKVPSGVIKKIKVWDKLRALDSIVKVMGYNAPIKQDHTTNGQPLEANKSDTIDYSKLSDEVLMAIIEASK